MLFLFGKGEGSGREVVDWVGVFFLFVLGMVCVLNLGYWFVLFIGLLGLYVLFIEDMFCIDDVFGFLLYLVMYGCGCILNLCDGVFGVCVGWGDVNVEFLLLVMVL